MDRGLAAFDEWLTGHLAELRRNPGDDLLSRLIRAAGGGQVFTDDELRKILVRAGAVRIVRDDGTEWWRLLSRMDEFIERKQLERIALVAGNADAFRQIGFKLRRFVGIHFLQYRDELLYQFLQGHAL